MELKTLLSIAETRDGKSQAEIAANLAQRYSNTAQEFAYLHAAVGSGEVIIILNTKPTIVAGLQKTSLGEVDVLNHSIDGTCYRLDYRGSGVERTDQFVFSDGYQATIEAPGNPFLDQIESTLDDADASISMFKQAAMDKGLNPGFAENVRQYYLRLRRGEEKQAEDYVFSGLYPHPERPITDATFEELYSSIDLVNTALGVSNGDVAFAARSRDRRGPGVSLHAETRHKGLKIISVTIYDKKSTINIMLRNDAGTKEVPRQVAGSRSTLTDYSRVLESDSSLPDDYIKPFSGVVRELFDAGAFTRKRRIIHH